MAIEITELKKRATMINDKVRMYLLPPLFNAAVRAGASIMNIYKNLDDYDISLKDDKTPIITDGDNRRGCYGSRT